MVEVKGNWFKLPSYKEVGALGSKKSAPFTKKMLLDILNQNRFYQSWGDSSKEDKGSLT